MPSAQRQKKKVFVGLSGGVDSSVTAALLKKEGYDVTGVFIKVWQPDFLTCTWPRDRLDAMRVCARLEIPFKTYDFEEEYKRDVVDYMIREYKVGRTPNPDVMCNTYIKFDAFLKRALEEGADYIATGHYVQKVEKDGMHTLVTSADTQKDQSYFLWGLSQDVLAHTLFPIGGYEKGHVRRLAKRFGLATAEKKESQGLCFLGKLDMRDFLTHFVPQKSGDVCDEKGRVIGSHEGAVFYTLGQRHGFRVHGGEGKPYFVVGKDVEHNAIIVSDDPMRAHTAKDHSDTHLSHANWIAGSAPDTDEELCSRSRYRQALFPCRLVTASGAAATVHFKNEKPVVPPGQSLVLYRKLDGAYQLLGGGVIESRLLY